MITYNDFLYMCEVVENPHHDPNRFYNLLLIDSDCIFEGVDINTSVISSIKRFHTNTNEYNRSKISELINNNVNNLGKVHKIVIDYELLKRN